MYMVGIVVLCDCDMLSVIVDSSFYLTLAYQYQNHLHINRKSNG